MPRSKRRQLFFGFGLNAINRLSFYARLLRDCRDPDALGQQSLDCEKLITRKCPFPSSIFRSVIVLFRVGNTLRKSHGYLLYFMGARLGVASQFVVIDLSSERAYIPCNPSAAGGMAHRGRFLPRLWCSHRANHGNPQWIYCCAGRAVFQRSSVSKSLARYSGRCFGVRRHRCNLLFSASNRCRT